MEEVSDVVHAFVQRCQSALSAFADQDYAARVSALWDCVGGLPPMTTEAEVATTAVAVCRLASGFFHAAQPVESRAKRSPRSHVNRVLRILRVSYPSKELTLRHIAAQLSLSQAYLSRALARETGHSFPMHLNCLRLFAAIYAMRRGTSRIADIATQVGYRGTGELDRQFQRRFRMSPRKFSRLLTMVNGDRLVP